MRTRVLRVARPASLAVAIGCMLGSCAAPDPGPNVLIIVVDTLRADHLGSYGYPLDTSPNLDRFASENLQFEYAISAAPWTSPSVASLFTAYYPTAHGVTQHVAPHRMPDDAISPDWTTLAEAFAAAGYATSGLTSNAWVSSQRGFGQGFDRFEELEYSPANTVNEHAFDHLDQLTHSDAEPPVRPFLLYLHYMDPHPPLEAPAELTYRFLDEHAALPGFDERAPEQRKAIAAYDAEIFFFDQAMGALFDDLKRRELYDDMAIAVVSDHGFPFMEHGAGWHGFKLHNEDTHVPLLLKLPGAPAPSRIDTPVSTIDLYPTLAGIAGVPVPDGLQGVSLLDQLEQRRTRGAFSENTVMIHNHRSLVSGDAHKLILAYAGRAHRESRREDERAVVGLFRSREDYAEATSLDDPEAIDRMREQLWAVYQESLKLSGGVRPATAPLDDRTIEELRRLGYVD